MGNFYRHEPFVQPGPAPAPVPLLVLIAIASAAALAAAMAAHRYPAGTRPALDVARGAGWHATPRFARLDPEKATGLALSLALVIVLAGALLLAVLTDVVRSSSGAVGVDSSVAHWGDAHETALSTVGLKVVTAFGETWMAAVVVVIVALVEVRRSRSRWVVPFLLAVVLGDELLTWVIKDLVGRVRPDLNPAAATLGPSFPSGHSSTSRRCGRRPRS